MLRSLFVAFWLSLYVTGYAVPTAAGTDLTIGIGADVTAIDPHYHNLTPNSNVAAHIFDYLVLRDERQKPIPGLAESWRTVDPLTWEFKLRRGVKFHDGSDFTAADVIAFECDCELWFACCDTHLPYASAAAPFPFACVFEP